MSWSLFIYLDSRLSKNGPSNSCWKLESLRPWFCTHMLLLLSRFSRVRLCVTPETAAHQASPSLGFSRQEHWSGLLFPSPTHESEKWKWSLSVMSDSLRPHGLQPTWLFHPWEFPWVPLPSPWFSSRLYLIKIMKRHDHLRFHCS